MKKLSGVESEKVSLNEGRASIELKLGNTVTLEKIRQSITDQGFTPKEARITAIGDLTSSNGSLQFKVSGTNEVFTVMETPHAEWSKHAGQNVLVSGLVQTPPTQANQKEPGMLQITEVSSQTGTNRRAGEGKKNESQ